MLSRFSAKTGRREYSCSSTRCRNSSMVASDRIATMSGRGVMTSRTSVSPKSTTERSNLVSAAAAGSLPPPATGGEAGSSPVGGPPLHRAEQADDGCRDRAEHVRHGGEHGQQQFENPLGLAAHDERRHELPDAHRQHHADAEQHPGADPVAVHLLGEERDGEHQQHAAHRAAPAQRTARGRRGRRRARHRRSRARLPAVPAGA